MSEIKLKNGYNISTRSFVYYYDIIKKLYDKDPVSRRTIEVFNLFLRNERVTVPFENILRQNGLLEHVIPNSDVGNLVICCFDNKGRFQDPSHDNLLDNIFKDKADNNVNKDKGFTPGL